MAEVREVDWWGIKTGKPGKEILFAPEYDNMTGGTESRTISIVAALCGWALIVLAALWASDAPYVLGLLIYTEQFLAVILALALLLVFLWVRPDGRYELKPPWFDQLAGSIGFGAAGYVSLVYPSLSEQLAQAPPQVVLLSSLLLVLIVEAVRRTAGSALAVIIIAFIAYGLFGHLLPGEFAGREMKPARLVTQLVLDPNAVIGTPLKIAATVVLVFVLFGTFLANAGGTEYFTNLSAATLGRYRGGSAKIAVVASGLFGSISGSAVSNVATTGIITIPLMRRAGFDAKTAAGIEAVASTGGQLMPPVMGASAFLMAEFLEIPYSSVVIAALIPGLLYYFALFAQADLRAARDNIVGVDNPAALPSVRRTLLLGWIFPIPFAVLIGALFWLNLSPEKAGLYATAVTLILAMVFGTNGRRMTLTEALEIVPGVAKSVLDIIVITAAAGIVIGVFNFSGLSFGLTLGLSQVGNHGAFLLLIAAAVISIILGMGMPTIGVYVLLAALIAPAMIDAGFDKIATHLFILYFGLMSMITPPIAIAAFAAAGIAKSDPMATGLEAVRFGWAAFFLPFAFIYSPGILLRGDWLAIVFAAIAIWYGSAAITGYLFSRLGVAVRLGLAAASLFLLFPSSMHPAIWPAKFALTAIVTGIAILIRNRKLTLILAKGE